MTTRLLSSLTFSILLFLGCSKNDTPSQTMVPDPNTDPIFEVYFTLNVAQDYIASESNNWIFLHNDRGELLDSKSYESGENLVFEMEPANITEKIAVTVFEYTDEPGNRRHALRTYTDIAKGSIWNLKVNASQPNGNDLRGENIGSLELTLTNIIGPYFVQFSDAYGSLGGFSNYIGGIPMPITESIKLYENTDELMISIIDGNGDFKYLIKSDISINDDLTIDYSEFVSFDSILNVNIPPNKEYFSAVYGYDQNTPFMNARGFVLNLIFPFNTDDIGVSPLPLGYLNRYDRYITQFSLYEEDYIYSYINYGAKPERIAIPENPTLEITNEAISDFSFSSNLDFIRVLNLWQTSRGERNVDLITTTWSIHGSNSDKITLGELPDEFLQNYPDLDTETLSHTTTRLYLSFESYSDMIQNRFVSQEPYNPFNSQEQVAYFK